MFCYLCERVWSVFICLLLDLVIVCCAFGVVGLCTGCVLDCGGSLVLRFDLSLSYVFNVLFRWFLEVGCFWVPGWLMRR